MERTVVGTVKYTNLLEQNVIENVDILQYSPDVLRDSRYLISDDGKGGIRINLVYKEPRTATSIARAKPNSVILESFQIPIRDLLEMRRLYAWNMIVKYN